MKYTNQFHNRRFLIILSGAVPLLALLVSLIFLSATTPVNAIIDYAVPNPIQNTTAPLCQFGVNVLGDVNQYDTTSLRMGWYVDYGASANPVEPNGADFAPIISLTQVGSNTYTYTPNGSQLTTVIAGNPGAVWFIGNEPDRRDVQDDIEPHLYAEGYHELYYLIKTADPSAKIFAGTIVQPTPLRLQYLDMVLNHYATTYSESMPVDGWSIHNFILNEVSCDYDPNNCWGAGIPPGIDAGFGEIVTIEDNDNFDLFKERIERFRQWMADNGYTDKPLYVSEYGVLMPENFGFTATRVNTFMNNTFNYMRTTTDPLLGNPNDGDRLVQKWSWFSTGAPGDFFNGYLFDPDTTPRELSAMGTNYVNYTAALPNLVDLYPSRISSNPPAPFSHGEAVTVTLKTIIANSGNLTMATEPISVAFYDDDPNNGGVQIGGNQIIQLSGCGDNHTVEVIWPNVLPGAYDVYVTVGVATNETVTDNNIANQIILVATEQAFLPLVHR